MPLECDPASTPRTIGESALDASTPRMDETDLGRSGRLSLQQLRPPVKLPGYEQEQFLGRGAFGEVWKAIDSNSGRAVAIKFYSHRGGLDWSHMAREVEKLQHLFADRYVVQLFGVGWESDPPYYVMEYMEYGSLEDRLRDGPMSLTDAVGMIRETARGLVHAHDKGILHCDLKPSNIMLDQDDRPRLADFGQARLKHDRAPSLGTLFYMAPEQADLTAAPDARWDVYALGTILYRMVTGKLPYVTDEIATSISSQGPIEERLRLYREKLAKSPLPTAHRQVPGIDHALIAIIDRCLAVDPKHRFRNVQSVLTALEARDAKRGRRKLLMLGLLGPALVMLVMGGVATLLFRRTLDTSQRQLVDRTLESDQFAAKAVAAQFALGLDKRWRILEQEAADPALRAALTENASAATPPTADLGEWLQRRHTLRNREFSQNTAAAYWFVLDKVGRLRAISPSSDPLLGKYFGYREYFHGQGHELSPTDPPPNPVASSHRSNVFRSQPTNRPAVAFSTPIFRDDSRREVIGILAMEAELGHFSDFEGSRNQFAVLVDLRPDQTGKAGLIVEHPHFEEEAAGGRPIEESYLRPDELRTFQTFREERLERVRRELQAKPESASAIALIAPPLTTETYHDPLSEATADEWLAAFEPVLTARTSDRIDDTGWAIVIQERRTGALRPFEQIRTSAFRGGWVALGLVALVVGALWGVVLLVIEAPSRLRRTPFFKGVSGATASSISGSASLSSHSAERSGHDSGGAKHDV